MPPFYTEAKFDAFEEKIVITTESYIVHDRGSLDSEPKGGGIHFVREIFSGVPRFAETIRVPSNKLLKFAKRTKKKCLPKVAWPPLIIL